MDEEMENFVGYRKARTEKSLIFFLPEWANNVETAVLFVNLSIVVTAAIAVIVTSDISSSGDNGSYILSFFGKGC